MSEDKFELFRDLTIKGDAHQKHLAILRASNRVTRETKQKAEMAKYIMQKGA